MPTAEFGQTLVISELVILRVKSRARDSLWVTVGGEELEKHVRDGVVILPFSGRTLCCLNAPTPFDNDGWWGTSDLCQQEGDWIKVLCRPNSLVKVVGLRFNLMDIEDAAIGFPGVEMVKAVPKSNPITGQHVELLFQSSTPASVDIDSFRLHMSANLEKHKVPKRINEQKIVVSARFKKI